MNNNIILIDDRNDFANQFSVEAMAVDIRVKHERSLEGLKRILPKHEQNYAAVVLDINCLTHDDQELEDPAFITSAISFLDGEVKGFPRFILTGDDSEFESLGRYYKDEKLFLKTPQGLDDLFTRLKYCIENSEVLQIKRVHCSIFELLKNDCFDEEFEKTLINLLQNQNESKSEKFGGVLRDARAILEKIYKVINQKDSLVVPNKFIQENGNLKFNPLMRHLNGFPNPGNNPDPLSNPSSIKFQSSEIYYLANLIYRVTCEYVHDKHDQSYTVSNYTIKSLINGLMELIIWSKKYLEDPQT